MTKKGDNNSRFRQMAFTLIELLVVIAIVSILAVVVLVAINPFEALKKSRNTRRLNDIGETRKAIDLALSEATASGATTPFPASTGGNSCTDGQATDGSGWVKLNTSVLNLKKYLASLPQDPSHTGSFCYTFQSGANGTDYELNSVLEDAGDAISTMKNDGGNNAAKYEIGTDLGLMN